MSLPLSSSEPASSRQGPPGFAEAMGISGDWLNLWENGELSDEVLADRVRDLVSSRDGARGFFVVALAGDCALMDRLPESLVLQLRLAGDGVVDLTARNLAMSTAMALHHRRKDDKEQAERSLRVQHRCRELLRGLEPLAVKQRLELLLAATGGEGEDVAFLERWGYDDDQKASIAAAIHSVAI